MDQEIDTKELENKLFEAKIGLLMKCPFYGIIVGQLESVFDESCGTAATDGETIYWAPKFLNSLSKPEIEFVLCHEIEHVVREHLGTRAIDKDGTKWNFATDYAINYDLSNEVLNVAGKRIQGIGKRPEKGLYDPRFAGMTPEEIYKLLPDNPGKSGGSTLDDHDFWKKKKTPAQIENLTKKIQNDVLQAAKMAPGSVPGSMKELIKLLEDNYIDWRNYVVPFIESARTSGSTWTRLHRRSQVIGACMPGKRPEKTVRIGCALDVSGSMTNQMLRELATEIRGVCQQFSSFTLTLWTFDTKVDKNRVTTITDSDQVEPEFEVHGRGGTDFSVNFAFVKESGLELDRLLVFTDGQCGFERCDPQGLETLWLIHGKDNYKRFVDSKPPFGLPVEYRPKKERK